MNISKISVLSLTRSIPSDIEISDFVKFAQNADYVISAIDLFDVSLRFDNRVSIEFANSEFDVLVAAYRNFKTSWLNNVT